MIQTVLAIIVLVLMSVGLHYEALRFVSALLQRLTMIPRPRIAVAIILALAAHFVEIVIFAVGWFVLLQAGVGSLSGASSGFADALYFSVVVYTTLGFGDIVPIGPVRLLAGIESLTGLVLITWTASFTYLEMRAYWFGHNSA